MTERSQKKGCELNLNKIKDEEKYDGFYAVITNLEGDIGDADLILAGITHLITVVLADKIHHHECIRNLKHLKA